MNIKHHSVLNIKKAEEHYSKQDGVPCTYVCTTDLSASDRPYDIFFRETPHPEFGNRYFGLTYDHTTERVWITNADIVETFDFGMVESELEWHYSQSHHDYQSFEDGKCIDGGRLYVRGWGFEMFKIKDGEFVDCE